MTGRESTPNKYVNSLSFKQHSTQFSIETYFVWFSALIFITEFIIDISLVTYYFNENHIKWACITLGIIIVPLLLCQIYSIFFLKSEKKIKIVLIHILLLGIPFRYYNILRRIDKDKMNNQEFDLVKQWIKEINAIQTLNSILQYFPQFLFQAYLISFRKYKCVITGVSSGFSGFSFLWYIFIYFYYVIKRYNDQDLLNDSGDETNLSTRIIDNLSTSIVSRNISISPGSSLTHSEISGKLKNFEKQLYKTDDKNFVSKKQSTKTIEKEQIFSFNKRKPIYKQDDFDLYDINNQSTEFYELNESTRSTTKINTSTTSSFDICQFNNENNSNLNLFNVSEYEKGESSSSNINNKIIVNNNNDNFNIDEINTMDIDNNRSTQLKRKGICSSQEMLHLVDIMNDNIPPEQIDVLAKSLAELSGGEESLNNMSSSDNGELDNKLLEIFPKLIDQKTLENIDAAIYENQIIFQERIRKNQLTIQNLKLQDEILSSAIDVRSIESKLINNNNNNNDNNNDSMSMNDYGYDVNRLNRLKHWRNYLCDLDTNIHDNSTVLNSSIYMFTTTSNSTYADLYINELDNESLHINKFEENKNDKEKKSVRWCDKILIENSNNNMNDDRDFDDENMSEDLYTTMINDNQIINNNNPNNVLQKNILVETINKINNVGSSSPLNQLKTKLHFDSIRSNNNNDDDDDDD